MITRTLGGGLLSLAALSIAGLLAATTPAVSAEDTCYVRDANGTCLDDFAIPATGQYKTADPAQGPVPAGVDRNNQPHGVVRLRQSTYIDAHDICRFVDNDATRGPGLFIGLRTRQEWAGIALEGRLPAGSDVVQCCRAITVNVCGARHTIPYSKLGQTVRITGGHGRIETYTCSNGTAGAVPTFDTSWLQTASGQCEVPADRCGRNEEGTQNGCSEDGENNHDDRGSGPKGGHNGQDGGKGGDNGHDHGSGGSGD